MMRDNEIGDDRYKIRERILVLVRKLEFLGQMSSSIDSAVKPSREGDNCGE